MARWSIGIGLALLAFLSFARVSAQEALPAWSAAADKAWWTAHPTPDSWPKAADTLLAQLEQVYQRDDPSCFSQPNFQGWMEHYQWVRLAIDSPDVVTVPEDLQTFITLGQDEGISHLFVEKLVPRNVKAEALRNLIRLARANPADLHEYAALGVAYSLVFDERFPADWPHHQVDPSAVPVGDLDIVKRFQFYVQANRDKKLELDLTQLRVEDLKYLVDSKIKLSELAYAQTTGNHIPYEHFDQAFFSIKYQTSRVSSMNQALDWPLPSYTLQDIEKAGGICVDQAYYASMLGKGRGIPTIYFTGEGTSGGHAWFGYLTRSGKWNLDCGRYASQNYPKGYALDPQTWQMVNDSTLQRLAKNGDSDPRYQPSRTALAWARLHHDSTSYPQMVEDARLLMPELAQPWQAEGDYMDQTASVTLAEKKAFYQNWMIRFQSDADMRVEGQKRLLAALKAANDPDAEALQRDIVLQNRSSGFDLGVQGSLGGIEDKFKAGDWDGAKIAYETSVRDFKDQGGGTFLHNVIQPYVMLCLQYGRAAQADDGLHFTSERMPMESGSILQHEFENLKTQVHQAGEALPEMEKWLGEMDQADYDRAWSESSSAFKTLGSREQFTARMKEERTPFGASSSRRLSSPPQMGGGLTLSSGKDLHGSFIEAVYTGDFDHNTTARESVIFMREDGAWRLLSYRIDRG